MIDKLILVLVAIFVSVCAWLFWHNAQSDGFGFISMITVVILSVDNYRLRKTVRSLRDITSLDK